MNREQYDNHEYRINESSNYLSIKEQAISKLRLAYIESLEQSLESQKRVTDEQVLCMLDKLGLTAHRATVEWRNEQIEIVRTKLGL